MGVFQWVFYSVFFIVFLLFSLFFPVSRQTKKNGHEEAFFAMVPFSVVTVGASKESFVFRQSFQRAGTSKKRRNNEKLAKGAGFAIFRT